MRLEGRKSTRARSSPEAAGKREKKWQLHHEVGVPRGFIP
jgi:hypothetical protein